MINLLGVDYLLRYLFIKFCFVRLIVVIHQVSESVAMPAKKTTTKRKSTPAVEDVKDSKKVKGKI